MLYAEGAQGIKDRIGNRGRRADRAGFTNAFYAEGIAGAWSDRVTELINRDVGSTRHRVVHKLAGEQLGVLVVNAAFKQHLPERVCDAALDLAFDQQRVDLR